MDVDDSRQQDHTADQIFKPETRANSHDGKRSMVPELTASADIKVN
ncbi:hypothetical protein [Bradyrhizobium sp. CCBAU 051011]|nr:hypothetical protein [Bradyrhizobium sp. CCBAU 051011]